MLKHFNNIQIPCSLPLQISSHSFLWNLNETMSWGFMRSGRSLGENLSYFQDFTVGSSDYLLQKSLGDFIKSEFRDLPSPSEREFLKQVLGIVNKFLIWFIHTPVCGSRVLILPPYFEGRKTEALRDLVAYYY